MMLLCGALTVGWMITPDSRLQAVATPTTVDSEALNALVAKLKSQQDAMIANQTKIEAQTALLKEEVRQARIYAGRAGGHR